jgi:hypothetical protein
MLSFSEWVIDRDQVELIRLLWEAVDPSAIAANQINKYLSDRLGIMANWYAVFANAARSYSAGMDQDSLAQEVANHIIRSLDRPDDKLAQAVQQVQAGDDPQNKMMALMTTAARLRARRFGENRAGNLKGVIDRRSVHISTLSGTGEGDGCPIPAKLSQNDEDEVNRLRDLVMKELDLMQQEAAARRKGGGEKYDLIKQIAQLRLANPPDFPGMNTLRKMFPQIGKTNMFKMIQEIQTALTRVAKKCGLEELQAGIMRRTA